VPVDDLVEVPKLIGLTPGEARDKVGDALQLEVAGIGKRIGSQDPPQGTMVLRGSTVDLRLDGAIVPAPSSWTTVLPAWSVVLVVVLAGAAVGRPLVARAVRRVRERRWVRRSAFRARAGSWRVPDPPEESVPALGIDFETDLHPNPLHLEEVSGARS
jgi:hypothetical protein